jgi:hypothetical protein
MLQEIERDPSAFIQGDDLAVYKRAGREPFAGLGDLRELVCEEVSPPGPERYSCRIPTGKTSVTVELDLVEPVLSFWQFVDQPCIHRFDKADFGWRQRAEGFGFHEECERSCPCVQRLAVSWFRSLSIAIPITVLLVAYVDRKLRDGAV